MDGAAVFRHLDAFEPLGKTFHHVFLKEARRTDAAVITFHRDRPSPQVRQHHGCDRLVIRREFAFRDLVAGKQDLFRVGDHFGYCTTANKRGWRSLPCTVHSMKPTFTTSSGRTQCARTRGRPTAFVDGALPISSISNRARRSRSSWVSKPVPILPA